MTVYVDDMRVPFGRLIMCHMWGDSRDELFAMADRIGVARKWFQNTSWEHFDISLSKRAIRRCRWRNRVGPLVHCAMQDIRAGRDVSRAMLRLNRALGWRISKGV